MIMSLNIIPSATSFFVPDIINNDTPINMSVETETNHSDICNNDILQPVLHSPFQIKQIQSFRLPIDYLDETCVFSLSETICDDLELVPTEKNNDCIYDKLFVPSHSFGKLLIPQWSKQYTTNTEYLNDTQTILKQFSTFHNSKIENPYQLNCEGIFEIWDTIKQDTSFMEKYGFIDWNLFKHLNQSSDVLQFISIANIMSPAMSLLMPIVFLVFPFILLKIQQIPITFSTYYDILKNIARHHFIGKTLISLESFSWEKIIYLIITVALYGLQIYQNVNSCIRYYKNLSRINNVLIELRDFTQYSTQSMENFLQISNQCPSYLPFNNEVLTHVKHMKDIYSELEVIQPFESLFNNISKNGYLLKCLYNLFENPEYESSIRFAMGFEGYIDNLNGVYMNIQSKHISYAVFDASANCKFKKQYYPILVDQSPVKNDCDLDKNIVITAPNASGKSTTLKSVAINIIFSQQVGLGFYESLVLNPYHYLSSYLNVPDTSERDSLFQAESRRCKEIIDIIDDNKDKRHFCLIDEIFSGTNGRESCSAGIAYLEYLSTYENVSIMLTTHHKDLAKHFKKSNLVNNYKMDIKIREDGSFNYTYKMKKGISKIKGAVRVLKDMNYPTEITDKLT